MNLAMLTERLPLGDFEAAMELERIWSQLTRALPFFTVCGCPIDCFEHSDARNQLSTVCAEHSAVTSEIFAQHSLDTSEVTS